MSDQEFRDQVRLTASAFAFRLYQRNNPAATKNQAHAFAERSWRRYVTRALDFLALCQADQEARAAAPSN